MRDNIEVVGHIKKKRKKVQKKIGQQTFLPYDVAELSNFGYCSRRTFAKVKSSKSKTMQELIGLCLLQLLVESRSTYRECRYKHNREGEIVILNVDKK